jgi:hypothetical protein
MYIRLERLRKTESVLLIDEIGRYKGQVDELELFMECIREDIPALEEDGYVYHFVDKECLDKIIVLRP